MDNGYLKLGFEQLASYSFNPPPFDPAANPNEEVLLTSIKWQVEPFVRILHIGYSFQHGATPRDKPYVVKLKVGNDPAVEHELHPPVDAGRSQPR